MTRENRRYLVNIRNSFKEWSVPDSDRKKIRMAVKGFDKEIQEYDELVQAILNNRRNQFTKEALENKNLDELQKIAALGRVTTRSYTRGAYRKRGIPMPSYTQLVLSQSKE